MKKNENILKRMEKYKEKHGIHYADTNSRVYKVFRIITTLSFIYFLAFNLLYITAELFMISIDKFKFADVKLNLVPIMIFTVIIITGYIFNCTKFKLIGSLLPILPLIFNLIVFYQTVKTALDSSSMVDTSKLMFDLPVFFFYRHLIPTVLLFICFAVMSIIDINARIKTNKLYNNIISNIYKEHSDINRSDLTDEEWENILNGENSSPYTKQFTENEEPITQTEE